MLINSQSWTWNTAQVHIMHLPEQGLHITYKWGGGGGGGVYHAFQLEIMKQNPLQVYEYVLN